MQLIKKIPLVLAFLLLPLFTLGNNWPIFKGNIYFTGNNDEIVVKNNNLKWLFQADDRVFNPIVSEGMIFFIDQKGNLYCLDEDYGKLIWKIDLTKTTSRFKAYSRSAGKVKYPLIQGGLLFLSDPIAIYAINKYNGKIVWARTGMRANKKDKWSRRSRVMVEGIYSNPLILDDQIIYGTRNMFMARETRNGHFNWDNKDIATYSGFPTFYDNKLITQSLNFKTRKFKIHCLKASTGKVIWEKIIPKPMKIFPPVVYKKKIYIPTSKKIYSLNIEDGSISWTKKYSNYITSIPSFTDRAILFSIGNSDMLIVNPENGKIMHQLKVAPKSGPLFVTIRDQLYLAHNQYQNASAKGHSYANVSAFNFTNNTKLWHFRPPFPGAISQPVASNGILYIPAGNYLYAVGTLGYGRIIRGGNGFITHPGDKKDPKVKPDQPRIDPLKKRKRKMKMRKVKLIVTDKNNKGLPSTIEVIFKKNGIPVYKKKHIINKPSVIEVPDTKEVELITSANGHIPKKTYLEQKEKEKKIRLDKIEPGKGFVVDNILFEINKAYLKKDSKNILNSLIKMMKQNRSMKIEVRGHTDSKGSDKYNQKLSEQRADSVIEYMIKNGISPERLKAVGFGEQKPIGDNTTKTGRAKNRRTEFYFIK